uniref:Carbamoyl phosphate synthase arginine-specific small chain n=1 Tax=Chlamydomonas euryale TaxID=1486919 RepID=A0A7R9Z1M4_9CHLO|mmetsp:Transcript_39151/g.116448  ORF Transcript_39151/g.116448 Transcript_39151/m.116448 type:complete len:473 (+) Transcript_39151:292-1710(+)
MLSSSRVAMHAKAQCAAAAAPRCAAPSRCASVTAAASMAPTVAAAASPVALPSRKSSARAPRVVGGARRAGASIRRAVSVTASADAKPFLKRTCRLVLEDGSCWQGFSFGATGTEVGEVVFNTALTGYEEIMSDPSYKGQFVAFTCPHIGNVGINTEDNESSKCHLGAIIIKDLSKSVSNYRSRMDLDKYCKEQGVLGIWGVDTRGLTRVLRDYGSLVGVVTTDMSKSVDELVKQAKGWSIEGKDLLSVVSCKEPYEWAKGTTAEWEFAPYAKGSSKEPFHVVAYDYGIKYNILRRLASYGCRVTVVPATYPADEVMKLQPDGIFFSNGPGDPSAAPYAVDNAKALLGKKPVFGICMGHQILGQAFGAKTFKLKFGHHGGNHPIRYNPTGRVEISAQNHNFAVETSSLPAGVEVTHINLNDGTCAGMVWADKKAMTIQYHPESSPGPHDADVCFQQFIDMMKAERGMKAVAA